MWSNDTAKFSKWQPNLNNSMSLNYSKDFHYKFHLFLPSNSTGKQFIIQVNDERHKNHSIKNLECSNQAQIYKILSRTVVDAKRLHKAKLLTPDDQFESLLHKTKLFTSFDPKSFHPQAFISLKFRNLTDSRLTPKNKVDPLFWC